MNKTQQLVFCNPLELEKDQLIFCRGMQWNLADITYWENGTVKLHLYRKTGSAKITADASECEVTAKPIKKSKSVVVTHNFQVGDGVKVSYTVGDHHFFHPITQITGIDGDRIHTDKGSFYSEDLELLDF